jgi:hypothetical protein
MKRSEAGFVFVLKHLRHADQSTQSWHAADARQQHSNVRMQGIFTKGSLLPSQWQIPLGNQAERHADAKGTCNRTDPDLVRDESGQDLFLAGRA